MLWLVYWVYDDVDEGVGYGVCGIVEIGLKIVCVYVCYCGVEVCCVWVEGVLCLGVVLMVGWLIDFCDGLEFYFELVMFWSYCECLVGYWVIGLLKLMIVEILKILFVGGGVLYCIGWVRLM